MFRVTLPCALLAAFLLSGCGIIQEPFASQKSGISTPTPQAHPAPQAQQPSRQQGVLDAAAARMSGSPYQPPQQQGSMLVGSTGVTMPQAQQQTAAAKIGLLVPLSGRSAALGQAMVNAAQLAVFDMGVKGFELMPRDTKGTADGAVQAAKDAMSNGAQLLVGPLFAADVAAVKPVVMGTNVNMLALSTDVSLAAPGAYVMGFAPAPQVERVVAYAMMHGVKNFAALIPSGPYGQLVSAAFSKAVKESGGTLVAAEPLTKVAELAAQKDSIDAIFLPLGGGELRAVAKQLTEAGLDRSRVHLLGTGLWDEHALAQGEPLLVGGWFAAPEPAGRDRFLKAYEETYGQQPPRLATLAYDSMALAAVLARAGQPYNAATLTVPSGFAGLDGIFRLNADGQIERGLAVLEVGDSENRVVDPSPSAFMRR